jgi:hypothetical protein
MPHNSASFSPQERLRRRRRCAEMWANLSDQERAVRLEKLRLAREKTPSFRAKAKAEKKKEKKAGVVTHPSPPGDTRTATTPDPTSATFKLEPRIPSALALHLAASLRRLWHQEPGHERPHATGATRPPVSRDAWKDRLSLTAHRLSVVVRELLDDRRGSVGYAALLAPFDRVQALAVETDRLRAVLDGAFDPAAASSDDARRAVDAALGKMTESLLAFDKADRARRRAVQEPLPRRTALPLTVNGWLPARRHRQGLREQAGHLRHVGTRVLPPNPPDRVLLDALGRTVVRFRDKLLQVREEYLGAEDRADLIPVLDRLAALTETTRNRLTDLASAMIDGTVPKKVTAARRGLCEDLVALADAVVLFDEDEREHEKVYRDALRAERQEREPPAVVVAEIVREALSREDQASSGDRERDAVARAGNDGVGRKLDELPSLLRGRGSALRETVTDLREEMTARLDYLGTAVDAIAVRQRESDRADDKYEASLQEWRDRSIQAEEATHDVLRSAIAEHVGSLEGRLAIVIRENFLRLAAGMPSSGNKPLRQAVTEHALRVRAGMLDRISTILKNLGEKG